MKLKLSFVHAELTFPFARDFLFSFWRERERERKKCVFLLKVRNFFGCIFFFCGNGSRFDPTKLKLKKKKIFRWDFIFPLSSLIAACFFFLFFNQNFTKFQSQHDKYSTDRKKKPLYSQK